MEVNHNREPFFAACFLPFGFPWKLFYILGVTEMQSNIGTTEHILEICDHALALAGYKVIDGDEDCIFIRTIRISTSRLR